MCLQILPISSAAHQSSFPQVTVQGGIGKVVLEGKGTSMSENQPRCPSFRLEIRHQERWCAIGNPLQSCTTRVKMTSSAKHKPSQHALHFLPDASGITLRWRRICGRPESPRFRFVLPVHRHDTLLPIEKIGQVTLFKFCGRLTHLQWREFPAAINRFPCFASSIGVPSESGS